MLTYVICLFWLTICIINVICFDVPVSLTTSPMQSFCVHCQCRIISTCLLELNDYIGHCLEVYDVYSNLLLCVTFKFSKVQTVIKVNNEKKKNCKVLIPFKYKN